MESLFSYLGMRIFWLFGQKGCCNNTSHKHYRMFVLVVDYDKIDIVQRYLIMI
jgi:hypothetical protein